MRYEYQYNVAMQDMMESIASAGSVGSSVGWVLSIAAYVLTALALYTIAQRRGIRKAWLAWIPVADVWILGSISDQFRYVVKGENKSKRKVLLILNLIYTLIGIVIVVLAVGFLIGIVSLGLHHVSEVRMMQTVLGRITNIAVASLVLLACAIVKAIIYYMALYDVYTSCEPKNNVLYLVLSIIPMIATVALPLFLFLCRDKDEGMPPRRESVPDPAAAESWQQDPLWEPVQPVNQEPWEAGEE